MRASLKEIDERIEAIHAQMRREGRRIFDEWYLKVQSVIRGGEAGLFVELLGGFKSSFHEFELASGNTMQLDSSGRGYTSGLLRTWHIDNLTDSENGLWKIGHHYYGGR